MTRLTRPHLSAVAVLFFISLLSGPTLAQDTHYKVGERVEYKDRSYPESWKEGTIVKVMPEYNQVVVRWDPRPDYPSYTHNGVSIYEQGYNFSDVRHIKGGAPNTPAVRPANPDPAAPANNNAPMPSVTAAGPVATTGGLMSKKEIIDYMRVHGYANGQPTRNVQVCKDLIEMIKRRGVQDRLEQGKDDLSPIAENGCFGAQATDVVAASQSNIGVPTTLDWLNGTWLMYVVGGTVDTAPGDGYIYRKNESTAKLGFLTIKGDGTYTWKVNPTDPPAKYVNGTWRQATPAEMVLQGGAGIVLQHAAEGADWIVFKYMDPFNKAERVEVEHMQYRGSYRRIGWRK